MCKHVYANTNSTITQENAIVVSTSGKVLNTPNRKKFWNPLAWWASKFQVSLACQLTFQCYLPIWQPIWQSEDEHKQNMLGFAINPCFQLNALLILQSSFLSWNYMYHLSKLMFSISPLDQRTSIFTCPRTNKIYLPLAIGLGISFNA